MQHLETPLEAENRKITEFLELAFWMGSLGLVIYLLISQ